MSLLEPLNQLKIPIVGSPLFIISNPDLVLAQCLNGIVGSFPALNAREEEGEPNMLEIWLKKITEGLDKYNQKNPDNPAAPFAVNHIVHRSNVRLEKDIDICAKWNVPIWITSLGARPEVNEVAHQVNGIVLHDVINNFFAKKAIDKGADGLVAVAAGAGGHAGTLSPFALIQEIREWFEGPLLLSGSISNGGAVLAAQAMGADLAYIGSAFIATEEANADIKYKEMITNSSSEDIIYTNLFTGVHGNYLKPSITAQGLDPANLETSDASNMNFSRGTSKPKTWKDIWSSGQGISSIKNVAPAKVLIDRLKSEYTDAKNKLSK